MNMRRVPRGEASRRAIADQENRDQGKKRIPEKLRSCVQTLQERAFPGTDIEAVPDGLTIAFSGSEVGDETINDVMEAMETSLGDAGLISELIPGDFSGTMGEDDFYQVNYWKISAE